MRILYVCRAFSGFQSSLRSGRWAPTGAPTIYKVIEALDRSEHQVRFVLTEKDSEHAIAGKGEMTVELDGLQHPLVLLSGPGGEARRLGRFAAFAANLAQVRAVRRIHRRFEPDIVYVDRANLWSGAHLARRGARVLLRIMGIYPDMWALDRMHRPSALIERNAYRAPFAMALCTEDGTGGETWMRRFLAPDTPQRMMLNGVSFDAAVSGNPIALPDLNGKCVVLFVGRLETIKGAEEFVEGALRAPHEIPLHFLIVGTGSQRECLVQRVAAAGRSADFTFVERVPHRQMVAVHRLADIYVSLNKLGNLSNANLEVMRAGTCMIFPESEATTGADESTDRLVPRDAAVRIPRCNQIDALAGAILRLARDPAERARLAGAMRTAAESFIPSWEDRIATELRLIEDLAA